MLLANSIEDETVKGTEYEPGVGMMSKFHSQLGQTSDAPKWAPVVGDIPQEVQEELVSLRPITTKTVYKLKNVEGDISDYIHEFLSDLSDAGLAMTTDSSATYTDSSMTKIRFDTAQ
jgi:hypothetical protein